jgi:molecular chaperone GrpE
MTDLANEATEESKEKVDRPEENLKEEEIKAEEKTENKDSAEQEEKKETPEEDFKSKYFYLAAELENIRKRHGKEKENLIKYGNEKVLSELLEVADNLERTLKALENETDEKVRNIIVGVEMVYKQFEQVLSQNGLTPVETKGKTFDPHFHEAMAQQVVPDKEEGEIILEYQKGYILNGRLLRPAKVVVAKKED